MSSNQRANDSYDEKNNITELTRVSRKNALNDDYTSVEYEDVLEYQELVDGYEFVEADYHSYTDVASSVSAGSSTNGEVSGREDETSEVSENEFVKKEDLHVEAKKGGAMGVMNKETAGASHSDDENRPNEVEDKTNNMRL
ncbi:hypothetical protein G6011_05972 [Alternaria panax]|uniref:Uncharacterized protein n=1 Tax=Alternaria panax TaxID=48097 RepID=A0AAD4I9L7_9PLEO|nr:hypothetical protein G6011_05972 [Alternaria panax]